MQLTKVSSSNKFSVSKQQRKAINKYNKAVKMQLREVATDEEEQEIELSSENQQLLILNERVVKNGFLDVAVFQEAPDVFLF